MSEEILVLIHNEQTSNNSTTIHTIPQQFPIQKSSSMINEDSLVKLCNNLDEIHITEKKCELEVNQKNEEDLANGYDVPDAAIFLAVSTCPVDRGDSSVLAVDHPTEKTDVLNKNNAEGDNYPNSLKSRVPVNPLCPVPKFLKEVHGIDKLRRAIGKELDRGGANNKCSNLAHYLSLAQCVLKPSSSVKTNSSSSTEIDSMNCSTFISPRPLAVLKPFNYIPKKSKKTIRLIVDIVSSEEDQWSKVSARNPRHLALLAQGGGDYGSKSMVQHAREYLQCAQQNPHMFKPPRIQFIFTSGIGVSLCERLEKLGIQVVGERIEDSQLSIHPRLQSYKDLLYEFDQEPGALNNNNKNEYDVENTKKCSGKSSINEKECCSESQLKDTSCIDVDPSSIPAKLAIPWKNPNLDGITKLNLDVTTLLAYVSNLTNGHTNVLFRSEYLQQQLEDEKARPQKKILDRLFKGRDLYICETAFKEFRTILETVGGIQEKNRAIELLRRIVVVPDKISDRTRNLDVVGNVKLRSVTIFGTGDSIEAVTISANTGFMRSAKAQGINYPVFLHESRALTEQKENVGINGMKPWFPYM